jgi:hypothetical protein
MAESPLSGQSGAVDEALDLLAPPAIPNIEDAYRRQLALQAASPRRSFLMTIAPRLTFLRRPIPAIPIAAALVLALSLFVSPVRTLADQFLTIFRAQDFALIQVEPGSLGGIPDLTQFGEMEGDPDFNPSRARPVANLAEASTAVGFNVRTPARLPGGRSTQPSSVGVTSAATYGFTFRAERARTYLESVGRTDFSLPPKFDGASLRVHAYPAAVLTYAPPSAPDAGAPRRLPSAILDSTENVFFVQMRSPELEASGVTAEEFREFLLSIPGIPPSTLAQLRAIGDWRTTLPVPVPVNIPARKVQVNGAPGLVFADPQLGVGATLWLRDGIVYAAGGPLTEAELLDLATSVP